MVTIEILTKGVSPGRAFLNNRVRSIFINYPAVDLGGSKNSSYHHYMNTNLNLTTCVNLPNQPNVDIFTNLEYPFPFRDNVFESVFIFNLLEHIDNYKLVIDETHRILKPKGHVFIGVPFLHQVHNAPEDFNRFTKRKLESLLSEFKINIYALENGPFSAAVSLLFPVLQFRLIKYLSWQIAKGLDNILNNVRPIYGYPLYYFVEGVK